MVDDLDMMHAPYHRSRGAGTEHEQISANGGTAFADVRRLCAPPHARTADCNGGDDGGRQLLRTVPREIRLQFLDQWMDGNLSGSESNLPIDGGGCCGGRLGGLNNRCHGEDDRRSMRQQVFRLVTEMRQIGRVSGGVGSGDYPERCMARKFELVIKLNRCQRIRILSML